MKRCGDEAGGVVLTKIGRFDLAACARPSKPKPTTLPKVYDLQKSSLKAPVVDPPPPDIAAKLSGFGLIVAIDVETHDWEVRSNVQGSYGQYGFYTIRHPDDFLVRVVQIGWVIGDVSNNCPMVKEYIVKLRSKHLFMKMTLFMNNLTHL